MRVDLRCRRASLISLLHHPLYRMEHNYYANYYLCGCCLFVYSWMNFKGKMGLTCGFAGFFGVFLFVLWAVRYE